MQTTVEIDEKTLIIRLPLQKPVRSKSSEKTLVIASTHSAVGTDVSYSAADAITLGGWSANRK